MKRIKTNVTQNVAYTNRIQNRTKCAKSSDTRECGYESLGFSIVEQAVHDYKNLGRIENAYVRESTKRQLEKFFRSSWCYGLCSVPIGVWEDFIESIKQKATIVEEPDFDIKEYDCYATRMKKMVEKYKLKQADIVRGTGFCNSSVSRYINGGVIPDKGRQAILERYFEKVAKEKGEL